MEKLSSVDHATRARLTLCRNFNTACGIAVNSMSTRWRGFSLVQVSNTVECRGENCSLAVEAENTGGRLVEGQFASDIEINITGLDDCACLK